MPQTPGDSRRKGKAKSGGTTAPVLHLLRQEVGVAGGGRALGEGELEFRNCDGKMAQGASEAMFPIQ